MFYKKLAPILVYIYIVILLLLLAMILGPSKEAQLIIESISTELK
jgi:hypothetical protein